jgi:hypothetical protein
VLDDVARLHRDCNITHAIDIAVGITEPVMASFDPTELVAVSVGLAELPNKGNGKGFLEMSAK